MSLSDLRKEDFIQEYKEEVQQLKRDIDQENNNDLPSDFLSVLTRDAHNIDFKPFVNKSYLEDPNEQEFSDSSLWLFDPSHLRHWLQNWQPLDTQIDGEAAWDMLPLQIIEKDETTAEQESILASRQEREDFWDLKRMSRKRQMLANYFIKKYHYDSVKLETCLGFAERLEDNAKKLHEFATDPFRADYKETLLKLRAEFGKSIFSEVLKELELAVVIERNSRNIDEFFQLKSCIDDPNERIFPACSMWLFSPNDLCAWRNTWQPFDMNIEGEAAWMTLPPGVCQRDEPTELQLLVAESRNCRSNLYDPKSMACRRRKLAYYFMDKYHLTAETLQPPLVFCDRLVDNERKLKDLIKK